MFRSTEPQVSPEIAAAGANSRSSRRRGAVLLEFAFCFPVFLMMTAVGTMDLGRAVWAYNIVAHASHEAVRYAIVHGENSLTPADADAIKDYVEARTFLLNPGGVTVTTTWDPYDLFAPGNDNTRGSTVRVRVQHTFTPLFAGLLVSEIPLVSTAEMIIAN